MKWYYADGTTPVGPVSEDEFKNLVQKGIINSDSLVWNTNMTDWQAYGEIAEIAQPIKAKPIKLKPPQAEPVDDVDMGTCSECGGEFAYEDMLSYQGAWVCARCKPMFLQKIREGVRTAGEMAYAGFWIRFAAYSIDGIILYIVNAIFEFVASLAISGESAASMFFLFVNLVIQIISCGVYTTWFLGKFGATPGKMACRLKVVTADGGRISYLRALGRYFAEMISGAIFCIGYLMAAFDEEKRALHDRICGTRVIKI